MLEDEIKGAGTEKKREKLMEILSKVRQLPPTPDSVVMVQAEKKIKDVQKKLFDLEEIEEKWKKGRHQFRSTAELQDVQRAMREATKSFEKATDKLESIRKRKRRPEDFEEWEPAAQKVVPKAKAGLKRAAKAPGVPQVTFMQQLKAKMIQQIKGDQDQKNDERADKPEEVPSVWGTGTAPRGKHLTKANQSEFPELGAEAPPSPAPKKAPRRPADNASADEGDDDDSLEEEAEEEVRRKKKAKGKKHPAKGHTTKGAATKVSPEVNRQKGKTKSPNELGKMMNYLRQCYLASVIGGADIDLLLSSCLGLPGTWGALFSMTWSPPFRNVGGNWKMVEPVF